MRIYHYQWQLFEASITNLDIKDYMIHVNGKQLTFIGKTDEDIVFFFVYLKNPNSITPLDQDHIRSDCNIKSVVYSQIKSITINSHEAQINFVSEQHNPEYAILGNLKDCEKFFLCQLKTPPKSMIYHKNQLLIHFSKVLGELEEIEQGKEG